VSPDFRDDAVQVQVPVVVHGQDDRGLTGMSLNLGYLLSWEMGTESGPQRSHFCPLSLLGLCLWQNVSLGCTGIK
jgi:hypothetical protein